jgi:DNA-binding NtrC family response regulator
MKTLMAFSDSTNMMVLCDALAETDMELELCSTLRDLRACLGKQKIDVIFCQARLPDGNFRSLLRLVDSLETNTAVVVCADFYDKRTYLDAMTMGAFDYIAFPFHKSEVKWIVENASRRSPQRRHPLETRAVRSAPESARPHA